MHITIRENQQKKMDTIRNERSRMINISWNNLFRNRP